MILFRSKTTTHELAAPDGKLYEHDIHSIYPRKLLTQIPQKAKIPKFEVKFS